MLRKLIQNSNSTRLFTEKSLRAIFFAQHTAAISISSQETTLEVLIVSKTRSASTGSWLPLSLLLCSLFCIGSDRANGSEAEAQSVQVEDCEQSLKEGWWERLQSFSFLNLDTRKRTFFKYEKRIRTSSTPEKIFEYFSSIEKDGIKYMASIDLLRALMPVYPPEGSMMERAGALLGEKVPNKIDSSFFSVFDTDGDNLISYSEYIIVLTLLSIPLKDVEVFFNLVDVDESGTIDMDEFNDILKKIQDKSQQMKRNRGGLRTGLKTGDMWTVPHGLIAKFFGKDGKKKLQLNEFRTFLYDLQNNLLNLEFAHYDYNNNGMVNGWDFARSICGSANITTIDCYLQKVTCMDHCVGELQFSLTEFVHFHKLENFIQPLSAALKVHEEDIGFIDKDTFCTVVKTATGIDINKKHATVVFAIFEDLEGHLIIDDFISVLQNRSKGHSSVKLV